MNMALNPPSASVTARVEITPATAIFPAANSAAALTVEQTKPHRDARRHFPRECGCKCSARQFHAAASQATPQQLPRLGQPREDGARWTAQLPGCLLIGLALQVTEHERLAVLGRQSLDLFVKHRPEFAIH